METITQSYLKSILNYDKDTGVFTWAISRGKAIKGSTMGLIENGYLRINIMFNSKRRKYQAHRLAWLYIHGSFPSKHIDHINHDRADNRAENLREVEQKDNNKNLSIRQINTSGITGVSFNKALSKWESYINIGYKRIRLGQYKDKNEAICARLHANRLYKFHPNHGK